MTGCPGAISPKFQPLQLIRGIVSTAGGDVCKGFRTTGSGRAKGKGHKRRGNRDDGMKEGRRTTRERRGGKGRGGGEEREEGEGERRKR